MSLRKPESAGVPIALVAVLLFAPALSACVGVDGDRRTHLHASPLEGEWRLANNRYRSVVGITVQAGSMSGRIGCKGWGSGYSARDGTLLFTPIPGSELGMIVHEAPCFPADRRSPKAHAYWERLEKVIWAASKYEISGDRLTLVTPVAERAVFRRVPRIARVR